MSILLTSSPVESSNLEFKITGSKSESNRLLILQALYKQITVNNCSNSDDSRVMKAALSGGSNQVDIHHAGTAMRFLTSYFALSPGREVVLTGSQRMQERPIKVLVEALEQLGANISYLKEPGYPPLKIRGQRLNKSKVTISASVSSQYISSLLLVGATLPQGLIINLEGKITSVPYIKMTLSLLNTLGIQTEFKGQVITVFPAKIVPKTSFTVESDWSSASYFYSAMALGNYKGITLYSYKESSLQGDAAVSKIFKALGVQTSFNARANSIVLTKLNADLPESLSLDLANTPDLAQTIACCCFGLGLACELKGLHTLKIKETDRLVALQTELEKLGATVTITNNSLTLEKRTGFNPLVSVATYQDHRMAMAFAPLALLAPIKIEQPEVVAKSYPDFWRDMASLGIAASS